MSRVDTLINAKDNISVKFLEFTRITSKGKVAVFFEGEDEKYYSPRISLITPWLRWIGVICQGKSKVIELRENIRSHSEYSKSQCMFFVDADFEDNSELQQHKDVYITPCYSIENLYCVDETFHKILSAEFKINELCEPCYENAVKVFNKLKKDFLEVIAPFNYFIREVRKAKKLDGTRVKLNLNNISLDRLVEVDLNQVKKIYNENDYRTIVPDLSTREDIDIVSAVDLTQSEEYFKSLQPHLWFRGKQNLEFLRVFLGKLKEDYGKKGKRQIFKEKKSISLLLTKANCISELSQYAETPECLRKFILDNS